MIDHLPLAIGLARRFRGAHVAEDDLRQTALLALVKAARTFDPDRGVRFSYYATILVLGELKRHLRDHAWAIRLPRQVHDHHFAVRAAIDDLTAELGRAATVPEIARKTGMDVFEVNKVLECDASYKAFSLDMELGGANASAGDGVVEALATDEDGFERVEQRCVLPHLLAHLDAKETAVIVLCYVEDLSQRETALQLGISQMQVSRVLARALGKLRALAGS